MHKEITDHEKAEQKKNQETPRPFIGIHVSLSEGGPSTTTTGKKGTGSASSRARAETLTVDHRWS